MAKAMKDVTGDGKFTYADVLKKRGVKLKKQGYGGKVMGKGGTVDYFAGGLVSVLGQAGQMSKNPTLQKLGKVASTIGGFTPAGKAVNMAGNVLQNFIPAAGAQPTQQAAPQQGGGLMNILQSPMAQNLINQFTAKRGMVVPNAKVRLLKLER